MPNTTSLHYTTDGPTPLIRPHLFIVLVLGIAFSKNGKKYLIK